MRDKFKEIDLEFFFTAVLGLKDMDECYKFFDDICTVPELKAIAQRLQVAKMLNENRVYNDIVAETGASTATISRVNRSLHYGSDGYRIVFDRLESRESKASMDYDIFARYYDRLTENIGYKERASYFSDVFKRYGSAPKRILDLACGTGSLAFQLEALGYSVIGVEASAEMLAQASAKLPQKSTVLFLQQKMEDIQLDSPVDGVVCALDSINHLRDEEKLAETFRGVAQVLLPGGIFVFDTNTAHKHKNILADRAFVFEDEGVFCVWENQLNPTDLSVEIFLDFFTTNDNELYQREQEYFVETYFSPEILEKNLKANGLELLEIFSEDSFEPVKKDDQRVVYIARKNSL